MELKKRITDYQNGIVFDDNPNYVSILVIERYFKKKYEEYQEKTAAFARVILDGAIITDKDAAIDLNTVGSYNDGTVIKQDTIMII